MCHALDGLFVQRRIANDASLADLALFQLELRLYQQQVVCSDSPKGRHRRDHFRG